MSHVETDRNAVEVLAADFAEQLRRGQKPSMADYIEQHPHLADAIREVFPTVEALERLRVKKLSGGEGVAVLGAPRPDRLGDLRIIRELGRGGMGVVYEAEQESLGRRVAVKALPPHTLTKKNRLHRFEREARTAARLHHTNIVPVLGVGHDNGYPYYVMQFIDGIGLDDIIAHLRTCRHDAGGPPIESVWRRVRGGIDTVAVAEEDQDTTECGSHRQRMQPTASLQPPLAATGPSSHIRQTESASVQEPAVTDALAGRDRANSFASSYWNDVARIGRQIAGALQYAHQHGTLHRDIKPGNIIIDAEGTAWVADFGLAKVVSQDGVTQTGDIIGTLRYMAPEQLHGQADARSDIYGLGLTLYELLTLEAGHDDTSRKQALLSRGQGSAPIAPRNRIATIPRDLETIVLTAIAEHPDHRYQTAGALAADLECFLDNRPIAARRSSTLERMWRWSCRNPAVAALSAVAILLLALVAITASVGYMHTNMALRRESAERVRAEATLEVSLEALDNMFRRFLPRSSFEPLQQTLVDDAEPDLAPPVQPAPSPATAALLSDLLAFYDRLAALNSKSLSLRQEVARATRRVGLIQERLGQNAEARTAYGEAIKRYEVLAVDAPQRSEYQLEIARIHNDLGNVERNSGGFRESGAGHETALAILTELPQQETSAEYRFELARTHYFLGAGARWRPRPRGEVGNRDPDEGRRSRTRSDPADRSPPETRRFRSQAEADSKLRREVPRGRRGARALDRHKREQHLNTAIELLTALADEQPEIFEYRRQLALCYRERSRSDFSNDAHKALTILRELTEQFPDIQDLRYDLSQTYAMVETRRLLAKERGQAEQRLREALAQAAELDENVPVYLLLKVRIHQRLASLLRRDAEERRAGSSLPTPRDNLPAVAAGHQGVPPDSHPVRADLDAEGRVRMLEAAEHVGRALELHALLPEEMLANPFFRGRRARLQSSLADMRLVIGRPDDRSAAIELYGKAKDELGGVLAEHPDARFLRPMIESLETKLAGLVEQESRPAPAPRGCPPTQVP